MVQPVKILTLSAPALVLCIGLCASHAQESQIGSAAFTAALRDGTITTGQLTDWLSEKARDPSFSLGLEGPAMSSETIAVLLENCRSQQSYGKLQILLPLTIQGMSQHGDSVPEASLRAFIQLLGEKRFRQSTALQAALQELSRADVALRRRILADDAMATALADLETPHHVVFMAPEGDAFDRFLIEKVIGSRQESLRDSQLMYALIARKWQLENYQALIETLEPRLHPHTAHLMIPLHGAFADRLPEARAELWQALQSDDRLRQSKAVASLRKLSPNAEDESRLMDLLAAAEPGSSLRDSLLSLRRIWGNQEP